MSEGTPDTDTGAAFAAGHATATAEAAQEQAATAEIKAEIAGENAEVAAAHAESAADAAWATMAAVDELREDFMARLEQLQRPPAESNPGTGAEGGGAVAPAPERKEADTKPEATAVDSGKGDKPKRKHGAGWWFGG